MTEPCRILVVDDSPTQLVQMKMLLDGGEFEVETAADGQEAIEAVRRRRPDAVVTDLQMPRMNGLELVSAIRAEAPGLPVILTTGTGSEEIAAEALIQGATSYVPKGVIQQNLADTVRQVVGVSRAASGAEKVCDCLSRLKLELELPNQEALVPAVIARFEEVLGELQLFEEMEWTQIAMALDESLLNAMIHGNLEVSSKLREVDDGAAYRQEIESRRDAPPYRDRRVFVSLTASRTQAVFVVRDEGQGFDVDAVPDPTDPANLENVSGRGLLLISAFMDEVKHNDRGNEITMLKRKATVSQSEGEQDPGSDTDL